MAKNSICTGKEIQLFCKDFGFSINNRQADDLSLYLNLLMQWNRVMNLVGTKNWRQTLTRLVLDSFYLADFIRESGTSFEGAEIWDLGAGAGIPGIPLRILWQEGSYWLIESREKRTAFLSTVLARCCLPGTHVFHGRAETFMPGRTPSLIISRAFMPWQKILRLISSCGIAECEIIFLTNAPINAGEEPGWRCVRQKKYATEGENKYFFSVTGAFSKMPETVLPKAELSRQP